MPINFPDSPAENDSFTSGGKKWIFNGTVWTLVTANSYTIPTGEVTTDKIATGAVHEVKLASAAVTAAKLASGAAVANIGYTPANVASPTFTGTVVLPSTTSIGTVSSTEIGYVDGVTSAIQTQLDSKLTATTAVTSNRNVLINGALDIWQRGTTFTASGVFAADRFIVGRTGGITGSTFTRVSPGDSTNLPQIRYGIRCQRDSGNTGTAGLTFGQVIETSNSVPLAGKQVTLSFYARAGANFTGTYLYSYVYTGTGTDQNGILSTWTGSANPVQGSHALTTTWARYSATGTLSSTTNEIFINLVNSPTGTAGANDWYEVTGIQLEAGTVATPFEFEDFGDTLRKCMRYFQKSFRQDIAPATATGNFDGALRWQGTGSGFGAWCHRSLPVIMRSAPVVTLFNPVSANAQARNTAAGVDIQSCTAQGDTSVITITASGTNDSAYQGSAIHYSLSAEL